MESGLKIRPYPIFSCDPVKESILPRFALNTEAEQ
jgi:hypothetical protein